MAVEVFPRIGADGMMHQGIYDVDTDIPRVGAGWPVNVGRAERLLSMAAGAALATYGVTRRTAPGGVAALVGAALAYRGATGHCNVYQALGIDRTGSGADRRGIRGTGMIADMGSDTRRQLGGSRGIHVEECVIVDRPLEEVYGFWRNLENLPRFMKHLESVSESDPGITHWVAKGPAGMNVEWDARIINERENELIGWQSLDGSTIATAGSVHFDEEGEGTRVDVHLQYYPPGGKLGTAVAWLFGEDPNQSVREDMWRFKRLLEIRSN